MSDKTNNDDDKLLIAGHDYDGIQELDNPLPQWWLVTFLGTVVFGVLYWMYYEPLSGPTLSEELAQDMAKIEKLQSKAENKAPDVKTIDFASLANDSEAMNRAKGHYDLKCATCHGKELQGLIGPNLVDNFWIHGKGQNQALVDVIRNGVVEKGMVPWKGIIKDQEIMEIVAFIKNQVGSSPPNPKAPEGEHVE
ncbi:MAG: cbb3-type cytochrome c oxidase N-terminal domain-containing protein [Bdellovibrionales bacterium]